VKKIKNFCHTLKIGPAKKLKGYNPYDMRISAPDDLDESLLMDTSIMEATEDGSWAKVAGPKQPPPHK